MDRPDLFGFEVGAIYQESMGDYIVEYVGTAVVNELDGQLVAVFRMINHVDQYLIATRRDFQNGQVFLPFGDALEFDMEADED